MPSILDAAKAYFDQDDWTYTQLEGKPVLRLGCQSDQGAWVCYAQAREDMHQFVFYSVLQQKVPSERRLAMAEMLTRANYNMVIGNFELDFSDGEVRYKSAVDVEGIGIRMANIANVVRPNLATFNRYLTSLQAVADGELDPITAITMAESPQEAPTA